MVNLHTTTTKVKIDHTIRPLLTHMVPPRATLATHTFSWWEWGLYLDHKYVPVIEQLLYDWRNKDIRTAKDKTNMIRRTA